MTALATSQPELTLGQEIREGSGQRVAATSPGEVRRAASGGAGLGARAPPAREVAADPGGRRGLRGLRAVPHRFLRNFQRCPAPRAGRCPGGSIMKPGLRLWGPGAQGAPPPAVTHNPATLSLGSPSSVATSRLLHGPRRSVSVPPLLLQGCGPRRCSLIPAPAQSRPANRPAVSFSVAVPPTPAAAPSVWDPVPAASPARPGARAPAARGAPRTPNSQHAPRFGDFRPSSHVTRAPLRRPRAPASNPRQTPPRPSGCAQPTRAGHSLPGLSTRAGVLGAGPSRSLPDPSRVFLLPLPRSSRNPFQESAPGFASPPRGRWVRFSEPRRG